MTHLDLFAGAGGASWFGKLIGARCVGYVEHDEYCQKVIRQRIKDGIFDDAPIFDDVRTFDGRPYRNRVDLVTAGFPCQPHSEAGTKRGADDERNLWPDTVRILGEVRPRLCLLENVSGIITNGYFGIVLGDLATVGYDAKWQVLSAADCGSRIVYRPRVWLLGVDLLQQRERGRSLREAGKVSTIGSRNGSRGITTQTPEGFREPRVERTGNGMASRRDRFRAIGNGWCVPVAYEFWQRMMADNEC